MIYYLIVALFPLACGAIYKQIKTNNALLMKRVDDKKVWWTFIAVLPMFLMFVLRYKYVGPDTIGYVRQFETGMDNVKVSEILSSSYKGRYERGFAVYVKLISLIIDSYTIFFLINGLIIFGTLFRFALKHTNDPFLFFTLFVSLGTYNFVMTGLRQTLAICICVWAIDFVKNRRLIWFLLFVTLAYFFHKSSVVFLLIYPLSSIKRFDWTIFWYSIVAMFFVVGFAFFQQIFNELLGYEYSIEDTGNGGTFLMLLVVLFLFSLYMQYDKSEDGKMSTVGHLAILAVVFWILRLISRTAERISYYYILGLYGYFANATQFRKGNLMSFVKHMLIFACIALFVYRNIGVYYKFFWQG